MGTKPSCPFSPSHSHVTLGGIDAVVQRLDGHPAHRETPLGENGFEVSRVEEGPVWRLWVARPSQAQVLRGGLTETHHRLLHINFFPARKAKVCDFGGQVLSNQHVSGSQVSVDELQARSEVRGEGEEGAWDSRAGRGTLMPSGVPSSSSHPHRAQPCVS